MSSSVYSCHLFLISSAFVRSIPFLSFIEPIFACNIPLVSPIFLKRYLGGLESVSASEVAQSCLTLCDPMDCNLPGSSVHGIFQARIPELVAISFSRGSSQPRDWTWVSLIVGRHFTIWGTREVLVIFYFSTDHPIIWWCFCWDLGRSGAGASSLASGIASHGLLALFEKLDCSHNDSILRVIRVN